MSQERPRYDEAHDDDEVTVPPTDPLAEVTERDWGDPADVPVSPEELRDGGPSPARGMMTTTGGTAGPASIRRRRPATGGTVAPTTTGDATSGGMRGGIGGSTSDATTGAESTTEGRQEP